MIKYKQRWVGLNLNASLKAKVSRDFIASIVKPDVTGPFVGA
jgi:hypothetical protein